MQTGILLTVVGLLNLVLSAFSSVDPNLSGVFAAIGLSGICIGCCYIYGAYQKEYKAKYKEFRQKKEEEKAEKERLRIKAINDGKHESEIRRLNYEEESKRKLFEARKVVAISSSLIMLLKECNSSGSDELLCRVIDYAEMLDPVGIKKRAKIKKGDVVFLGKYTINRSAPKPIEWIVLDVSGNLGLLTTRYILDEKPFQTTNSTILWANSDIRKWLNSDFFSEAFTDTERETIINMQIQNGKEQGCEISYDNNHEDIEVDDNVFLLSYQEAYSYFSTTESRQCGNDDSSDLFSSWWLRSPGHNNNFICFVNSDGKLEEQYIYVSAYPNSVQMQQISKGVRPAIWVKTESDIFHSEF